MSAFGYSPLLLSTPLGLSPVVVTPDSVAVSITAYSPSVVLSEWIYPTADISAAAWLPSTGSNLYTVIDEVIPDDADYIYAEALAGVCEIRLGTASDPLLSTGHAVSYRIWRDSGGPNLNVHLYCGATLIASWNHASVPTTPTTYEQELSVAEADSITDYSDLRLRFEEA